MSPLERAKKKQEMQGVRKQAPRRMELSVFMKTQKAKALALKSIRKAQKIRKGRYIRGDYEIELILEAAEKFLCLTGKEPYGDWPPDPETIIAAVERMGYTLEERPPKFTQSSYAEWLKEKEVNLDAIPGRMDC